VLLECDIVNGDGQLAARAMSTSMTLRLEMGTGRAVHGGTA